MPVFWRGLNNSWRNCRGQGVLAEDWLPTWLDGTHVRDPWLEAVVSETVDHWTAHPSGPAATLADEDDEIWFRVPDADTERGKLFWPGMKRFSPVFSEPFLMPSEVETHGGFAKPSTDSFKSRMRKQFNAQLRKYVSELRSSWDQDYSPEIDRDAMWTAWVFTGTYTRGYIAQLIEDSSLKVDDSASMVQHAVSRFAAKAGLTLWR